MSAGIRPARQNEAADFGRTLCCPQLLAGLALAAAVWSPAAAMVAVAAGDSPAAATTQKDPAAAGQPASETDLSQYYGFGPLDIVLLDDRSAGMIAADINHDGLNDLLISNPAHSRLDLLLQRAKPLPPEEVERTGYGVNSLPNSGRYDRERISVDRQVVSMAVGDFDGDGRRDVACFTLPDQLVIRYGAKDGTWLRRKLFRLPDVPPRPWNMAAGDLNQDGLDDIAVLGGRQTWLLLQKKEEGLAAPESLLNTSEKLTLAQIADLDGDGRNDLCYVAGDDDERVLCARFQSADGQPGPELRFDLENPRGLSLANIDGKPGQEVLAIDSRTGRLRISQVSIPQPEADELSGRLVQYGFGDGGAGGTRDLATADFDGDGLTDVVVTDPDGARLIVFRQRKGQGLDAGTAWPGLLDVQQVRAADFNGDGRAEIVVLSGKEKTLGLTQLTEGRLAFPVSLPATGEPQAVELMDLDADGKMEVLYVSRQRDGGSSKYELRVLQVQTPAADAKPGALPTLVPGKLGGEEKVELDLRGAPRQLLLTDADADGQPELLIYPGLDRPPHHYRITAEGKVKEIPSDDGIGIRDVQPGELFIGTLDGKPVTLAAHQKFVRNLRLEQDRWVVVEQYNATESEARVAGTAALDLDGQPGDEIVLIDSGIKRLRVLRKKDGVYRPWKEVELGRFPYLSSKVADLDGDGRQDLLLFGRGKFAVLYAGRVDPQLTETATFESKLKDTWFADVVAGDLNGDGRPDVVLVDTQSHYMELLHFGSRPPMEAGQPGTPELRHALHFPVYEEKSFQRSEGGGSEPRETLIQDVTGDGRADLILLIHDRLLVYPQDSGEPEEKPAGEKTAAEKTAKP